MARMTRRGLIAAAMATGVTALAGSRLSANSGTDLPVWGENTGTTDLQAGPLGLNAARDPGQVPVAMRIADAGVDAEVERQQIVDGQMLDPTGPWVVAWYEQTARAGEIGNFVASGHKDYWKIGRSIFYDLADVPEGALIDVTGKGGTVYTYAVTNIRRIDVTTLTVDELNSPDLVGHTDYAALTLITCGGSFNGQEYLERDILRAELVSVQSTASDEPAEADAPPEADDSSETGDTATVNTDGVNLRNETSTESEVLEVLDTGTNLIITGDAVEANGYIWLPVSLEDGTSGWVVQDFVTLP